MTVCSRLPFLLGKHCRMNSSVISITQWKGEGGAEDTETPSGICGRTDNPDCNDVLISVILWWYLPAPLDCNLCKRRDHICFAHHCSFIICPSAWSIVGPYYVFVGCRNEYIGSLMTSCFPLSHACLILQLEQTTCGCLVMYSLSKKTHSLLKKTHKFC